MNIKPTELIIKNIGKIAGEQKIEINKPLILFYGEIRQVLATIVGERPANIPPEIGVFVVEEGKVQS